MNAPKPQPADKANGLPIEAFDEILGGYARQLALARKQITAMGNEMAVLRKELEKLQADLKEATK